MLIKTTENNKSHRFQKKVFFNGIRMLIIIYPEQMGHMICLCCFPDTYRS